MVFAGHNDDHRQFGGDLVPTKLYTNIYIRHTPNRLY
jgi:hypothetical protein